MSRCCGEYQVSEDTRQRQWRLLLRRKCTDIPWLVVFFLFCCGLVFISGYSLMAGAAERLIFGYDSYGNVCGRRNSPIPNAPFSGKDMTDRKHVFFLDSCNMQIRDLRINSTALCVSSCPQEELTSLQDLQHFAKNNGSQLCVYKLNYTEYTNHPKVSEWCPALPVPPSKSFPLFNRCVPQNPDCYSKFASILINVINEVDFFHRILSGIMAGRDNVVGLSILAVALSVVMVLSFRYISTLMVHIFVTLLMFGLLFVTGVLWWLYYDHIHDVSYELETEKENAKFLLGFSIISTLISIVLLTFIFLLRKRIQMTIRLFQVASSFTSHIPFLLLQPLWTFLILLFYWILWVAVLLSMGTSGSAQVSSEGQVEYKPLAGIRYMWWYHVFGLIWTSEFFLTCQQIVISGATVTWYLHRDKKKVKHPILSSLSLLFWYHLGTAVMGSLLLMLLKIPQIILMYLSKLLSKWDNACTRCTSQCCFCGLWSYGKWLRYLNQNAYTATVINGTSLCTSAREAYALMEKNPPSVSLLKSSGVFLIFLGKVFVVCFTVFGGLMAFNYHRELHVWVIPLLLVAFFAYLVAHSFLSLFETVVHSLLMCYAIDMETNDGSSEKPYFMDQDLMTLIQQSNCDPEMLKNRPVQNGEDGTELRPIARAD
ncbi:choline transporter-like protein 3 [Bufo gargarizans]|uniref:choline transporter-like protein 3 n=1 Tax=Bufo gargarizans TaxID=30331 RepID=UPI001CF214E4|nr:choline transporter-like protein 3 [Bufo gargarizans]